MRISDWSSDVCSSDLSTMLQAVSRVAEAEGRTIRGLAFQNKMVGDLAEGAGIQAQTIASFVLAHERFIAERNTPRYEAARERLAGTMRLVAETSMVTASDMLRLHDRTRVGEGKRVSVSEESGGRRKHTKQRTQN